MKNISLPVYFYPLAAMLFWGMSFVWTSLLLKYYEPVTIIFIRLVLSSVFLYLLIFLLKKHEKVEKKDNWWFILSAIFNPFLYFLCENYGVKFSTSTIAAVIIATIPLFSPVVAYFTFRERLSVINIIGIIISFSGIILMLIRKDFTLEIDLTGIIFLGGAVIAALVYSVFLRKLTLKYHPLTIISRQNLIGVFLFLPVFLLFEARSSLSVVINQEIIASFLLLAILASSLSYVFYSKSVQVLGISKSNIFSNLIPVFTAIFSFFILSESFTLQKIAGMVVVVFGIYLSEIPKFKFS